VLPVAAIPTPEQVHAVMAARPVFTATSRPTRDEVLGLIGNKVAEVDPHVRPGLTLTEEMTTYIRTVLIYGTAADVEQSYFPEQNEDDGPARVYAATYLRMLEQLSAMLGRATARTLRVGSVRLGFPQPL
jgi:hypothetical protein